MFKKFTILSLFMCLSMQAISLQEAWQTAKNAGKSIVSAVPQPASYNPRTWFNDNYHKVMDNVFRSKTMSAQSLQKHIQEDAIKSILILREIAPGDKWFEMEKQIADAANIAIHHIELNAREFPSREKIQQIINIFKDTKDAILIHCVAGVDRTGAISAVRKLMENGTTLEQALEQLNLKYGHHEWRFPHMKEFIKRMYALKEQHGSLDAALQHYNPAEEMANFKPGSLPVRAIKGFYNTIATSIKEHPYISSAIAIAAITTLGTYLYKTNRLSPVSNAMHNTFIAPIQRRINQRNADAEFRQNEFRVG
jgi:protein tyrosine/serine phosphatase